MSFYGSMKANYVNAKTEIKLVEALRNLEIEHDGMLKIINVYPSTSGFTAWYYHDILKAGLPVKKKAKKKTKKTTKVEGN
jgi:hypothetical protein